MKRHLGLCSIVCALFCLDAHAKLFRNAYVSFELPPNWNCNLEGTEWVCINQFEQQAKEAIIILTAKEVGPTDSIAAYQAHLEAPRSLLSANNQSVTSKVISVKQRQIAGHLWVDGMHMGSEVSSYYTRYLATVKERIAILVTFSAHKAHYTKYSSDFIKAIESLRVVATRDLLDDKPMTTQAGAGTIGAPIGTSVSMDTNGDQIPQEESTALGRNGAKVFGLLFLLAAVIAYYLLKSKKKLKRRSPPPNKTK